MDKTFCDECGNELTKDEYPGFVGYKVVNGLLISVRLDICGVPTEEPERVHFCMSCAGSLLRAYGDPPTMEQSEKAIKDYKKSKEVKEVNA